MAKLEDLTNQDVLNIAILDACRNDPFATRNLGETAEDLGLAAMQARGTLIAFSTAPNSVAIDGDGTNGLYTSYLLKHILTPGIDIKELFEKVGSDVAKETNNEQRPWYNTSVYGSFTFVPVNSPVPGQITQQKQPDSTADLAMFQDTGSDKPTVIQNDATLQSGDGYFFHVKTGGENSNYIYIYQVDSSRKVFRLFPNKDYHTTANPIPAGTRVTIPNDTEVFYLDNTIGKEVFYFIASSSPVPSLERLEKGTIDDIMNSGLPMRGPQGVRKKTDTVVVHSKATIADTQEFIFSENLVHTLTIDHK